MQNIYSVSWVNAYVRNMISQDFMLQSLYVKGEASNVKYHSSGHLYFTLKDEQGAMPCVMFADSRSGLKFRLEEGMQIVVFGSIDVYERDGRYQLYAREITLSGVGALYERFEKLKNELEEMGMFDPMYKKEIPKYIRRLGVVTAPTGAAVRDIISIAKRRNPGVEILLYPAIVQGERAPESIVNGIRALDASGVDVMIVGRGGGSYEDLCAFNEKIVANAIFDCDTPVISAVGHETDTTIADYAADLRAPTPSAAAELAVFEVSGVISRLTDCEERMNRLMLQICGGYRLRLENVGARLKTLSPEAQIKEQRMCLLHLEEKLDGAMDAGLGGVRHRLELAAQRLYGLSPLKKLGGGYAFVSDRDGNGVKDIHKLHIGDDLTVHLIGGQAKARVTEVIAE